MAFDSGKVTAQQLQAQGLCNIDKLPGGAVIGFVYASVGNMPQGHLQLQAMSMDALKLLHSALGQWIAGNSTSILVPNGRPS